MEADLARFYPGVDYRDRWRRDEYGRPLLSLRKLALLVQHLPADSAVGAIGRDGPHWSVEAHLLDDVRMWLMILAGADKKYVKPHTQRPVGRETPDPARQMKLIDARKRARERKRKIEAGEIT